MFWVYFQVVLAFCIFVGIVWWTIPKSPRKPVSPPAKDTAASDAPDKKASEP